MFRMLGQHHPNMIKMYVFLYIMSPNFSAVSAVTECLFPVHVSTKSYIKSEFGLVQPTVLFARKWHVAGTKCALSVTNKQTVYGLKTHIIQMYI